MKSYTIGEIYRLGLMKNHRGDVYASKGSVSVAARGLARTTIATAHGPAAAIPKSEIDKHNKRMAALKRI